MHRVVRGGFSKLSWALPHQVITPSSAAISDCHHLNQTSFECSAALGLSLAHLLPAYRSVLRAATSKGSSPHTAAADGPVPASRLQAQMACPVNVTSVDVLDNPSSFLNPLQFEIQYECNEKLEKGGRNALEMLFVGCTGQPVLLST